MKSSKTIAMFLASLHLQKGSHRHAAESSYRQRPTADHPWLQTLPPRTPQRPSARLGGTQNTTSINIKYIKPGSINPKRLFIFLGGTVLNIILFIWLPFGEYPLSLYTMVYWSGLDMNCCRDIFWDLMMGELWDVGWVLMGWIFIIR